MSEAFDEGEERGRKDEFVSIIEQIENDDFEGLILKRALEQWRLKKNEQDKQEEKESIETTSKKTETTEEIS
jgi:hypothetical protein